MLRRHCDDEARDYDTITETILARVDPFGDADAIVADMRGFADMGIDTVIFVPVGYTRQLGTPLGPRLRDL